MAIFHCSVKAISRASKVPGATRSAVAFAAYRTGTLLIDEQTGRAWDYRPREGVMESFILLPEGAPPWLADHAMLWNTAERAENRKDARVAREVVLALPHELNEAQMRALVRDFALHLLKRYGVAVDAAMHRPHAEGNPWNYHAHLQMTVREVDGTGLGKKTRVLDGKRSGPQEIIELRKTWEALANGALERAGFSVRIDHRSHKARGIMTPPQHHVGVNAMAMHRKGTKPKGSKVKKEKGREVDYPAIDQGRTRAEHNAEIIQLQKYRDAVAEQQEKQANTVKPNPALRALIEQVARMEAKLASMANDIALLQAAIGEAPLPEGFLARVRMLIERAWARVMEREESEWLRERSRRQKAAEERQRELEAKTWAFRQAAEDLANLARQRQEIERAQALNRQLERDIYRMGLRLNGMPPFTVVMRAPLSASFNEAAYTVRLQRQTNADLLRALNLPAGRAARGPPSALIVRQQEAIARNPALATVALRRNVLQTKELLARLVPPEGAEGRGAAARAGPQLKAG
ncbi:MAG: hypothetical protein EPN97_06885 [Alphaproteobacteria bacterium]|nr:MAG: hypothetical protein EPN97_06885 [Alphaproteobacteria bacterium]